MLLTVHPQEVPIVLPADCLRAQRGQPLTPRVIWPIRDRRTLHQDGEDGRGRSNEHGDAIRQLLQAVIARPAVIGRKAEREICNAVDTGLGNISHVVGTTLSHCPLMKSRMQETLPLIIHSSVSRLGKCSGLSHAGNPEVTAAADREYPGAHRRTRPAGTQRTAPLSNRSPRHCSLASSVDGLTNAGQEPEISQ